MPSMNTEQTGLPNLSVMDGLELVAMDSMNSILSIVLATIYFSPALTARSGALQTA